MTTNSIEACETARNEENQSSLRGIVAPLLTWYDENARILPWRVDNDPYRVWVSEIMLQQTQVETVIPYYNRFLERIPDILSLANTEEEQLLKLWEGLGYYGRVRSLQKAARKIVERYGGKFPTAYGDILGLPGIGKYTAGAIASICFGQPVPAVDGNVLRVVARLTGCSDDISSGAVKNKISQMLETIYPSMRSGDFTQSLMELGATVCLPKTIPGCGTCPCAFMCVAFQNGVQADIPVKSKKLQRRKERKTVFLLCCGDTIAVRKREAGILLGGLWEFPNTEGNLTMEQAKEILARWGITAGDIEKRISRRHIFTHVEWDMSSYTVFCEKPSGEFVWVTKEKLSRDIALPSAFKTFVSL